MEDKWTGSACNLSDSQRHTATEYSMAGEHHSQAESLTRGSGDGIFLSQATCCQSQGAHFGSWQPEWMSGHRDAETWGTGWCSDVCLRVPSSPWYLHITEWSTSPAHPAASTLVCSSWRCWGCCQAWLSCRTKCCPWCDRRHPAWPASTPRILPSAPALCSLRLSIYSTCFSQLSAPLFCFSVALILSSSPPSAFWIGLHFLGFAPQTDCKNDR